MNGHLDVSSFLFFSYVTENYRSGLAEYQLDRCYFLFIDEKTRWSVVDDPTHWLREKFMWLASSFFFLLYDSSQSQWIFFFFSLFERRAGTRASGGCVRSFVGGRFFFFLITLWLFEISSRTFIFFSFFLFFI
jgi:hypothetical protein